MQVGTVIHCRGFAIFWGIAKPHSGDRPSDQESNERLRIESNSSRLGAVPPLAKGIVMKPRILFTGAFLCTVLSVFLAYTSARSQTGRSQDRISNVLAENPSSKKERIEQQQAPGTLVTQQAEYGVLPRQDDPLLKVANRQEPPSKDQRDLSPVAICCQDHEEIKGARLVSGGDGFVWSTRHVVWTPDGGRTWSDITPLLPNAAVRIDFVAFQDNTNGWALLSSPSRQGTDVALASTSDRGATWVMKQVPLSEIDEQMYSGRAAASFVDSSVGWIMLRLGSSSNASIGTLFATADSGNTWTRLPDPPAGDPILFTSAKDGWIAGGPGGDDLFATRDGGWSWSRVDISGPIDIDRSSEPVFDLPTFQSDSVGSLLVTYTAPTGSALAQFRTSDGGVSWQAARTIPVAARLGLGVKAQYSVIDASRYVFFEARNGRISSTHIGTSLTRKEGAFAEGAVDQIAWSSAFDDSTAWVVASGRVLATGDGGLHWIDVTPSQLRKKEQSPGPAKEQQQDLLIDLQPNLVSFQGKGFDTCGAPTISDLQAWWNDPTRPYKFVNMYYGGSDRGCKTWNQSMITASWMNQVSAMGWALLPTWVGPQAPNTWPPGKYNLISTNTVTAQQQGSSEASAAAPAAASIGLAQGEILYVDIEGQYAQDAITRAAVKAYVNGWVTQLHSLGYKAGAYGSAYNVGDWASIANPPDAVWIVKVFFSNSCDSVFGLDPLPDNVWTNHQRLRQCTQGHNETHNSVTLNIDTDLADGPLSSIASGCNAPGAFSLTSPSNGQSVSQTSSVTLSWGTSPNANSYDVYFGTSSNPPFLANQTGTSRAVSVTLGQTYFWKVVARVNCNSSLTFTAGIWSFSVQASCNAPGSFSLISPTNGQSLSATTSATLSWGTSANADSYDVYFGTSSNPPLLANQTGTGRSVSVAPGQTYFWKVVARVNCNSSLTFTAGIWSFSVNVSTLPDLIVTQLTAPTTGSVGGQITVSVTVANQGSANAGAFRLGFYFSTDSTITTGDTFTAWCDFPPGLAAGASATCGGPVGVPSSLSPGTYYFGAIADDLGAVAESNESNNARSADTGPIVLSATTQGTCASPYNLIGGQPFNGNTSGGQSSFGSYSCIAWNESGPERVHTITLGSAGTLTATLSNLTGGDLDVFILSSCSSSSCLAFGDNAAVASVGPGTYYILVDGFNGAIGGYTLTVNVSGSGSSHTATVGLYVPSTGGFYLRNSNTTGGSDTSFSYGPGGQGWIPLVGDWDGNGTDTIGLYNPANGAFYLRNSNSIGFADITFTYGPPGQNWIPVTGDWNGDGVDTVGLYNPSNGVFYLRNTNSVGVADITFSYGPVGQGWIPIAGDWNGDGVDTVGLYNPSNSAFYLRNSNTVGNADTIVTFGPAGSGWTPIVGDWNGDGTDTIGLYNASIGGFYLRNSNSFGGADVVLTYGPANAGWTPIVGDWDGL
jgi:hypothetical protein